MMQNTTTKQPKLPSKDKAAQTMQRFPASETNRLGQKLPLCPLAGLLVHRLQDWLDPVKSLGNFGSKRAAFMRSQHQSFSFPQENEIDILCTDSETTSSWSVLWSWHHSLLNCNTCCCAPFPRNCSLQFCLHFDALHNILWTETTSSTASFFTRGSAWERFRLAGRARVGSSEELSVTASTAAMWISSSIGRQDCKANKKTKHTKDLWTARRC